MPKVMLSPSDQYANTYAYGDTNEGIVCQRICELVKKNLLTEYSGFEVEIEPNMYAAVKRTNEWRPDLHLAVHTNACPEHTARGSRVFYHSASKAGDRYARIFYESFFDAYWFTDVDDAVHRVSTNDALYELHATIPVAVYLEIEFHDNIAGAKWILDNEKLIAEEITDSIVQCLCDFFECPHCGERIYFR